MAGAPAVLVRGLVLMHRAYVRFEDGMPANENLYAAARGFRLRGAEIVPFTNFSDIPVGELGPDVCVCGYVGDVQEALRRMGKPIPAPLDYPEELKMYLGRTIRHTILASVFASPARLQPFFVKPVAHKLFDGFVWDGSPAALRAVNGVPPETCVWVSAVVNFTSEWRVFVLNNKRIGLKHYSGNPFQSPNPLDIAGAILSYRTGKPPAAYALDFGVTRDGTVLVEANDAFALGSYGLTPALYAQMIEARWRELVGDAR